LDRRISESRRRFLSDESRDWVEWGVISDDQRDEILGSYAVAHRLPAVILILGTLMVGIGVLSFIAANWQWLPAWFKITMISGGYIASVAGAYFCERSRRYIASEVLLFFSGFLFMGGFALNSQVFHIDMEITGVLSVWLVAFAPTLLISRNIPIYVLYEAVALIFLNIFCAGLESSRYIWREYESSGLMAPLSLGLLKPALLTVFLVAVAWWMRFKPGSALTSGGSKVKMFFLGGSTRAIFWSNFFIINWFTWMCIIHNRGNGPLPFIFSILFIGIAIETMSYILDAGDLDLQGLICIAAAGFALTFEFMWEKRYYSHYTNDEELLAYNTLIWGIALAVYLAYRIFRRQRFGGLSVFLFCALLARWYFDMFQSFSSKSLFFTIGGFILIAIAFAYWMWSRYFGGVGGAGGAAVTDETDAPSGDGGGENDDDRS
jgi:uncharacterized membrane protein